MSYFRARRRTPPIAVLDQLHAARDVEVDDVDVDGQRGPFDAVPADRGPHAVRVDAEEALRQVEAGEEGTVEPAVDDLSGPAARAVVEGRHLDVDVDVERQPAEHGVDPHVPAVIGAGRRLGAGNAGSRQSKGRGKRKTAKRCGGHLTESTSSSP
jgi:hypothetical protein